MKSSMSQDFTLVAYKLERTSLSLKCLKAYEQFAKGLCLGFPGERRKAFELKAKQGEFLPRSPTNNTWIL